MEVINKIISDSAIGRTSILYKSLVLLLFSTIVSALVAMFILLLINGTQSPIRFGYLYAI